MNTGSKKQDAHVPYTLVRNHVHKHTLANIKNRGRTHTQRRFISNILDHAIFHISKTTGKQICSRDAVLSDRFP